jgi:hypothetical protein
MLTVHPKKRIRPVEALPDREVYAQWGSGTNGPFLTERVKYERGYGAGYVWIDGALRRVHIKPGHVNKPNGRYFINHDGAHVPLTFVEN